VGVVAAIAKPFNPLTLSHQIAIACGWAWKFVLYPIRQKTFKLRCNSKFARSHHAQPGSLNCPQSGIQDFYPVADGGFIRDLVEFI
jgi:hypothetical protein